MLRATTVGRVLCWTGAGLVVLFVAFALYYLVPVIPDPAADFMSRKGTLREAHTTRTWQQGGERYEELTLVASSGLHVAISIRRPLMHESPLPVVVLLGGFRTGRDAGALLPGTYPAVIASLSYPYGGDLDMTGFGLLDNLPHVQQALRDITPAILLCLDYLLQQTYADPAQVELVGVSLGAFLVPVAAAVDERISRLWLVQGAGDPRAQFEYRLQGKLRWAWGRDKLAGLVVLITGAYHLKPERWIGRFSPRPVMVINSRQDTAFAPASVQTLHAALREPYEIIWLQEGGHIRPDRAAIIQQLSDIVLQRIVSGPI